MADEARHCLVISDGRRGIENQALGLAEGCASLRPLTIQTYHIAHGKRDRSAAAESAAPAGQI